MSTARNVIVLCMCLIVGGWPSAVSAREGISVSPSVSNNYVIPPQQATKQINFDVHLSGSKVGYSYRYRVFVDNRYRQTQDVAYVPGSSAFGLELEYGYHSIAVYLDRMHALPNEWTYGVPQNSAGVTLDQDFRISVQNAFDSDPCWYWQPEGTIAYEWTGALPDPARFAAEHRGSMPLQRKPAGTTEVKARKPNGHSAH